PTRLAGARPRYGGRARRRDRRGRRAGGDRAARRTRPARVRARVARPGATGAGLLDGDAGRAPRLRGGAVVRSRAGRVPERVGLPAPGRDRRRDAPARADQPRGAGTPRRRRLVARRGAVLPRRGGGVKAGEQSETAVTEADIRDALWDLVWDGT